MDFNVFIIDELLDKNIWSIIFQVSVFIFLYLFLFKDQIWNIFDPLFIASISMAGAAFCVWRLYWGSYIDKFYIYSFVCTELALVLMMVLSFKYFSMIQNRDQKLNSYRKIDIEFVNIFLFISGLFVVLCQLISFYKVGIILLEETEGVNHVSAYDGHGFIRALLIGSRVVFVISFFYKFFIYKLKLLEKLFFVVYLIGIVLGGSKSGVLEPVFYYLILNYYLYKRGLISKVKIKILWILLAPLFPIMVIIATSGANVQQSIYMFGARIIGSGDIFILGYDRDVINSLSEKSFLKYVLYPGFGSVLKTIGIPIEAPNVIGPDIYDYYYGIRTGGPNARHNYFGLVFLGSFLSVIYSATCGFVIGYIRATFTTKNKNFLNLMASVILYNVILTIITDINIFMNRFIWSIIILLVIYSISNLLFNLIYKRKL